MMAHRYTVTHKNVCTQTYTWITDSIHDVLMLTDTKELYLPPGDLGNGSDLTNGEALTPVDHTSKPQGTSSPLSRIILLGCTSLTIPFTSLTPDWWVNIHKQLIFQMPDNMRKNSIQTISRYITFICYVIVSVLYLEICSFKTLVC